MGLDYEQHSRRQWEKDWETRVLILNAFTGRQRRQRVCADCSHRRCGGVIHLRHLLSSYSTSGTMHRAVNTDIRDKVPAFGEAMTSL